MQIWVDADATPVVIKEILTRAAMRKKILITFVANQYIQLPNSSFLRALQVPSGFDVADNEIVKRVGAGELVITADIPLAAEVLALGADALSPRGEKFTQENIRGRLNIRDFMDTLRSSGVQTGGPKAMGATERRAFANALDVYLGKL